MRQFRPYPRRAYRRRFIAWANRNRTAMVLVAAGLVVLLALETIIVVALIPASGFKWWLLGTLQTAIVGVALHMLNAAFLAHDREAPWHLRGAWGEEFTRDELRQAKRKHLIWGWVDSINLRVGDIDHLVVTRKRGPRRDRLEVAKRSKRHVRHGSRSKQGQTSRRRRDRKPSQSTEGDTSS